MKILYLLCSLAFYIKISSPSFAMQVDSNPLSNSAYIWQGFHHKWERTITGFFTPHRMGSFGNRITNQSFTNNATTSNIDIYFTPGVNGDWAYPSTSFSIVYDKAGTNSNKDVQFSTHTLKFDFEDEATKSAHPHTETTIDHLFQIPTNNFDSTKIVLNGFNILMNCTDTACNSNGIWPTKFVIDISNCTNSPTNDSLNCNLLFILNRGFTPLKGGGKPFNYKMAYKVEIEILAVHSENLRSIEDTIAINSNNHAGEVVSERKLIYGVNYLQNNTQILPVTGITAIGFEFLKYKNNEDLGRYIGDFQFEVSDAKILNGAIDYAAITNINSADHTVIYSDVNHLLKTNTFLFENKNVMSARESGDVCRNDFKTIFFCRLKGLENKNSVSIKYEHPLSYNSKNNK